MGNTHLKAPYRGTLVVLLERKPQEIPLQANPQDIFPINNPINNIVEPPSGHKTLWLQYLATKPCWSSNQKIP